MDSQKGSHTRIKASVHSRIYIENLVIQCSLFYVPTQPLYILKQIKSKSSIYFVYLIYCCFFNHIINLIKFIEHC